MSDARAALIVGAGDATGGAIARRFAREGLVACVTRRSADKLDPLAGLQRLASWGQLANTLKSCLLALALGAVGAWHLAGQWHEALRLLAMPLPQALGAAGALLRTGLLALAGVLAVFALVDVPLQRRLLLRRLRMSVEEMKKEMRDIEGNTEVKAKMKLRMREVVNRRMLAAAKQVPGVTTLDLYGRYPDYHIHVPAEQARLAAARLLVLLHPIHWYSMPPLQKLWLDEVFTWGWAYGASGTALQGKGFWLAATTGGPEASYHPQGYNRYFFDAFLPPYEQTAALCGMRFLPPMLLHSAHTASDAVVAEHVATFAERLQSYPHWSELDELEQCPQCEVPGSDRPVDAEVA